eukprot:m.126599 g.126599  ORF g.126599 m.126599 type:complete len:336 (-) comp19820_c0_seq5:37-1044(-)
MLLDEYEVPAGLLTSLYKLSEMRLLFLLDDSGSMNTRDGCLPFTNPTPSVAPCTRWKEMHERLKLLVRVLARTVFVELEVRFFNSEKHLTVRPSAFASPAEFERHVLAWLDSVFSVPCRGGSTPLVGLLDRSVTAAMASTVRTSIYVFSDGEPNDTVSPRRDIRNILAHKRQSAAHCPVMFISCGGDDSEMEWMKEMESMRMPDGSPSYLGEVDDYISEKGEVMKNQAGAIPYSHGLWLVSHLIGAVDQSVDAIDGDRPLTRRDLEHIFGYKMSRVDYAQYWEGMRPALRWRGRFDEFYDTTLSCEQLADHNPKMVPLLVAVALLLFLLFLRTKL